MPLTDGGVALTPPEGSPVGVLGAGGPLEGSPVWSQVCQWPGIVQGTWPGLWLTLAPLSASRRGQKCQNTRVSYVCRCLFNLVLGCGEVGSVGSQCGYGGLSGCLGLVLIIPYH